MNHEKENDEMNRSIRNEEMEEDNNIVNDDIPVKEFHYEEKNYDLNDYLARRKENRVDDNLTRSLGDTIKDSESTISEIISKIEEKETNEDLFADLMPDSEDTIVTEKAPEETSTFVNEATKDEKLDNFISETAINNFIMNKDLNDTNSFMEIEEEENTNKIKKNKPKVKKIAIILFVSSILMLIGVIIYISAN